MTKNNRKGFTIIEVVLVLAIAGLIFLMVFIALPALQRSQRNTRRRQDMSRILSAFTEYQSNVGHMPDSYDRVTYPSGKSAGTELSNLVNKYITGKNDYSTAENVVSTALTDCQGNDQFCDPDGTSYHFQTRTKLTSNQAAFDATAYITENHAIYYYGNAKCGSQEAYIAGGSGTNDIALLYKLEGGAIYCGDNQ